MSNPLYLPSDNNKEDISLGTSNNCKERIKPVDIYINEKDISPRDIDK